MSGRVEAGIALTGWMFRALAYSLSRLSLFRLPPVRAELFKQLEATGVRSLTLVGAMGVLAGTVIIDLSVRLAGAAGEVPVKLLGWTLFGEAGALAVGFLVAARAAPTMAADLALMRFRGELQQLAALDIPVADYLVVPRVVSLGLMGAVLGIYFMASALIGGMLLASLIGDFSFIVQLSRFFETVEPLGVLVAILKCGLFGGAVALISCYYGLMVERDVNRLAEASSDALTVTLLALGLIDAGGLLLLGVFV